MTPTDDGRAFSRYVGMRLREVDDGSAHPSIEGSAPVSSAVRGPAGGMSTGVLLTLADGIGGLCGGLAVLPRWVVSTNLMLRIARPEHTGPVRGTARVLRRGRNGVVTAVELYDEGDGDALVGEAVLTSAALEPPPGMWLPRRPVDLDPGPLSTPDQPLNDTLGVRTVEAPAGYQAAVRLDVSPAVRNPWGIVHGGATAMLVDAAAPDGVDVVLHFLRPGRTGPMEARARSVDGVARVDVYDIGADHRRTAGAVVRRRR